jgi:hypothetical protein
MITQQSKDKITRIVKDYESLFSSEFEQFRVSHKIKVDLQKDDKSELGETVEQLLVERPEQLFNMLKGMSTEKEWEYLTSKDGLRWFARTFPQYAIARII